MTEKTPTVGDLVRPTPKIEVPEEVQDAVRTLIRWTGDDPEREGLIDTREAYLKGHALYNTPEPTLSNLAHAPQNPAELDRTHAASALGIGLSTLRRKLAEYRRDDD